MNNLKIFENTELGAKVRAVSIDNEPWFVARDIAVSLGYAKPENAVFAHCKRAKSLKELASPVLEGGSPMNSLAIPEADVYRLIMRSQLPSAERFQDWVVEEILPSIRKTGIYAAPEVTPDMLMAAAEAMRERDQLRLEAQEAQPKLEWYERVSESNNVKSLREVAKLLNLAPNMMNSVLRQTGIFIKGNLPNHQYDNGKYFKICEYPYQTATGWKRHFYAKVTAEGERWLARYFDRMRATDPQHPVFQGA